MCLLRLLIVWSGDKAGAVVIVACFPDHNDLVDRDVAILSVVIPQVQHARFYFQHLTTQARRAAAVDVDLLPDKSC